MKRKFKRNLIISLLLLTAFILWTIAVRFIDVKSIGPNGSSVGFSQINLWFHNLTGKNLELYTITDWLGLVPIVFCMIFAVLGLVQWINRKNILKVDFSILILGVFYIFVITAYLLFEMFAINYRPILINGYLEASYPSSTTLLVLCVMPTAIIQANLRIKSEFIRKFICLLITAFILFMVIGRAISGVHWISDIIGGILLSSSLVTLYYSILSLENS